MPLDLLGLNPLQQEARRKSGFYFIGFDYGDDEMFDQMVCTMVVALCMVDCIVVCK